MNSIFLKHHRQACEIITDTYGNVMAAIYFTPTGSHKDQTKKIFKAIQERTHFACENLEGGNDE